MMHNLFANSPSLNHPISITRSNTLMLSLRWNKKMSVSTISIGHPSSCVLAACLCWKHKELYQAKGRVSCHCFLGLLDVFLFLAIPPHVPRWMATPTCWMATPTWLTSTYHQC